MSVTWCPCGAPKRPDGCRVCRLVRMTSQEVRAHDEEAECRTPMTLAVVTRTLRRFDHWRRTTVVPHGWRCLFIREWVETLGLHPDAIVVVGDLPDFDVPGWISDEETEESRWLPMSVPGRLRVDDVRRSYGDDDAYQSWLGAHAQHWDQPMPVTSAVRYRRYA